MTEPISDAELAEIRQRLSNPQTILTPVVRALVARIDALQADNERWVARIKLLEGRAATAEAALRGAFDISTEQLIGGER